MKRSAAVSSRYDCQRIPAEVTLARRFAVFEAVARIFSHISWHIVEKRADRFTINYTLKKARSPKDNSSKSIYWVEYLMTRVQRDIDCILDLTNLAYFIMLSHEILGLLSSSDNAHLDHNSRLVDIYIVIARRCGNAATE